MENSTKIELLKGEDVLVNEKLVHLTANERGILEYLMRFPNEIISIKELYENVWDQDAFMCENMVFVHMSHLRAKIGKDIIKTKYKKGYIYKG